LSGGNQRRSVELGEADCVGLVAFVGEQRTGGDAQVLPELEIRIPPSISVATSTSITITITVTAAIAIAIAVTITTPITVANRLGAAVEATARAGDKHHP
jgi:hypothetical protein